MVWLGFSVRVIVTVRDGVRTGRVIKVAILISILQL